MIDRFSLGFDPIVPHIVAHCGTLWPNCSTHCIVAHCGTLRHIVAHCDTLWNIVRHKLVISPISHFCQSYFQRKKRAMLSRIVLNCSAQAGDQFYLSPLPKRERERERAMLSSIIVSHELVIFLISAVSDCPQLFLTGSRDRGQSKSGVKESSF